MKSLEYAKKLVSIAGSTVDAVLKEESDQVAAAAELIIPTLADGGMLHIFGAGHSHLFAEEITFRAGGLVPINPILDIGYTLMASPPSRSSKLERLDGFIETVMACYEFREGEVLIVMSQSGRNPGPVGAALYAKDHGLKVVAVTSVAQSKSQTSRHKSGKRLFELADIIIDNHVPTGDAAVELKPGHPKVAPLSTIVGATILQGLVAEIAGRMLEQGIDPPIWISANVDGSEEHNQRMASQLEARIKSF
jgi:uncharacterized phosphosugar-binding protein